jgi:3-oxoacyl-[acyl-carrier protein] reductase
VTRIDLDGRVAVITGGARGIGLAVARMMLAYGARVALWDADGDAMEQALLDLHAGDPATGSNVDVADENAVAAALRGAVSAHGKVDILVNSAGIIGAAGDGSAGLGTHRQPRLAGRQGGHADDGGL